MFQQTFKTPDLHHSHMCQTIPCRSRGVTPAQFPAIIRNALTAFITICIMTRADAAPAQDSTPPATAVAPQSAPQSAPESPAPLRVKTSDNGVIITGPPGYCIDRGRSAETKDSAFILLGSCAALGGGRAKPSGTPAVLTASVGIGPQGTLPGPIDPAELARWFSTAEGLASLSRAGDAHSVRLLHASALEGALLLRIEDRAASADSPLSNEYSRLVTEINARTVTLSVLPFREQPLDADTSRDILADFLKRVRRANR